MQQHYKGSTSIFGTHRELEPERLQLQQANRWEGEAQREKMACIGELDLRNKLSTKKIVPEIAKKLRNYGEIVAKKKVESDNLEIMNFLCNKRGMLRL